MIITWDLVPHQQRLLLEEKNKIVVTDYVYSLTIQPTNHLTIQPFLPPNHQNTKLHQNSLPLRSPVFGLPTIQQFNNLTILTIITKKFNPIPHIFQHSFLYL
jgi:hypothetical protein